MSDHYLLALRLPGNVERTLGALQQTVFERSGALSSQALPPIIPVCGLIEPCRPVLTFAGRSAAVELGLPFYAGTSLCMPTGIRENAFLPDGRCATRTLPPPLLHARNLVWLAGTDREGLPDETGLLDALTEQWKAFHPAEAHRVRIRTVRVQVLAVRTNADLSRVDWETIESRHIRLSDD